MCTLYITRHCGGIIDADKARISGIIDAEREQKTNNIDSIVDAEEGIINGEEQVAPITIAS